MAEKRKRTSPRSVEAALPPAGVGGYVLDDAPIVFNADKATKTLKVRNTGDRPIQVGSHFHFFEVNRALAFDRAQAFGMHLDIPSSTAIRFEPGDERTVHLVPFGGRRHVYGFNNLVDGAADGKAEKTAAVARMRERKYQST
jgi:urease subunit beta